MMGRGGEGGGMMGMGGKPGGGPAGSVDGEYTGLEALRSYQLARALRFNTPGTSGPVM